MSPSATFRARHRPLDPAYVRVRLTLLHRLAMLNHDDNDRQDQALTELESRVLDLEQQIAELRRLLHTAYDVIARQNVELAAREPHPR